MNSMPGLPVHHQLPESTQTQVHWVGDAIQPSHPLSSPFPPAFNLSQHQGLFKRALRIRWPKYWSFSFNISPSNEHSGLISFRMDWLDLLVVQGIGMCLLPFCSLFSGCFCSSSVFFLLLVSSVVAWGFSLILCFTFFQFITVICLSIIGFCAYHEIHVYR